MKMRFLLGALSLFSAATLSAQESSRYEIERDMPLFLDQVKASLTYPLAWENAGIADFDLWRNTAKQKVMDCMLTPPPLPAAYDMEIIASQEYETYTTHRIEFNLTGYSRIPAYLLVPHGEGPFPAVVMLHDHGARFSIGKEKMVYPFDRDEAVIDEADKWVENCYEGQYAGDYFAANGYVVIAMDALFWSERGRKEGPRYDSQQAVAATFMQLGMSWSGYITWEDIYTVDFLASLSYVDQNNITCAGFSMGGYRAWMLAAMSDKINMGAAICWMDTTPSQISWDTGRTSKGGSDYSMQFPGVRNYLDFPHIATIACPKPMIFYNGIQDKLFRVSGVEDAYGIIRGVWKSQKADDLLVTRLWDTTHIFNKDMQREVLDFFNKNLK